MIAKARESLFNEITKHEPEEMSLTKRRPALGLFLYIETVLLNKIAEA